MEFKNLTPKIIDIAMYLDCIFLYMKQNKMGSSYRFNFVKQPTYTRWPSIKTWETPHLTRKLLEY